MSLARLLGYIHRHIFGYAPADAPRRRTKIRRNPVDLFISDSLTPGEHRTFTRAEIPRRNKWHNRSDRSCTHRWPVVNIQCFARSSSEPSSISCSTARGMMIFGWIRQKMRMLNIRKRDNGRGVDHPQSLRHPLPPQPNLPVWSDRVKHWTVPTLWEILLGWFRPVLPLLIAKSSRFRIIWRRLPVVIPGQRLPEWSGEWKKMFPAHLWSPELTYLNAPLFAGVSIHNAPSVLWRNIETIPYCCNFFIL